MAEKMITWR